MERRVFACIGAAALLLVCWITWIVLYATSDPDLLALSLDEVAATIEPAEPAPPLRIAVFSPANEETGAVEKALRKRFDEKTGWKVLDRELQEEAVHDAGAKINPRPRTAEEAKEAGKKLGVEAAFFADVARYNQNAFQAEVAVKWGLIRIPTGDLLAEGTPARAMDKGFFSLDHYRARIDHISALFRIFLWVVTVLVLPVALIPLDEKILGLRNNGVAAGLLAFYTVAAFAAFLLLDGFRLFSFFWAIAGVLVLAGSALYTLAVLNAVSGD